MRLKNVLTVGGALLLLIPAAAAGQRDQGCGLVSSGTIEDQTWSDIQAYIQSLQAASAFDKDPLVSDVQTMVKKGKPKQAKGVALIAGRPLAREASLARLELGCFVGMINSEFHEKDIGAFKGLTFVWVDRQGPDDAWRSIQFPLDEQSSLDAGSEIGQSFLVDSDSGRAQSTFAGAGVHVVYKGLLTQISLNGLDWHGARWLMHPLAGVGKASPGQNSLEAMGCYRCDGTTCCPMSFQLAIF